MDNSFPVIAALCQCAIFLIIKRKQCQNHSSEIKETPLRLNYLIFRSLQFDTTLQYAIGCMYPFDI